LIYARGSCGELRTQIYIGLDIGYIENEIASNWIQETKEISAMIVGLIKSKKSEL
jgi:four helix bundle protein